MSTIQFAERILKRDKIGRIWFEGNDVFCRYEGRKLLLKQCGDPVWAKFVFKHLLFKLGRCSKCHNLKLRQY